jgi:hypothetical protein
MQAQLGGYALQQLDQRSPLGVTQAFSRHGFELIGCVVCGHDHRHSAWGQAQRVSAPVLGVGLSTGQPKFFQVIDQADHHIAVDLELIGQFLLGLAVHRSQTVEHRKVPRLDAQAGKALCKRTCHAMPDLGQEEHGTRVQWWHIGAARLQRKLSGATGGSHDFMVVQIWYCHKL